MNRLMANSVLVVAYFVGGTSLLGFAGFLLAGYYHRAFYTVVSGTMLILMMVF